MSYNSLYGPWHLAFISSSWGPFCGAELMRQSQEDLPVAFTGSSSLAQQQISLSLYSQTLARQADSDRKASLVMPASTQQPSTPLYLNYKIPGSPWYPPTGEHSNYTPRNSTTIRLCPKPSLHSLPPVHSLPISELQAHFQNHLVCQLTHVLNLDPW